MAWTSFHFAVGMAGGAALTALPCLVFRRGWRLIPVGMTLGGIWACIPDATRLFSEDFPNAPFASTLGSKGLRDWLAARGDWFFFHARLDAQPHEYALHGLFFIILFYNLALFANLIRRRSAGDSSRLKK